MSERFKCCGTRTNILPNIVIKRSILMGPARTATYQKQLGVYLGKKTISTTLHWTMDLDAAPYR